MAWHLDLQTFGKRIQMLYLLLEVKQGCMAKTIQACSRGDGSLPQLSISYLMLRLSHDMKPKSLNNYYLAMPSLLPRCWSLHEACWPQSESIYRTSHTAPPLKTAQKPVYCAVIDVIGKWCSSPTSISGTNQLCLMALTSVKKRMSTEVFTLIKALSQTNLLFISLIERQHNHDSMHLVS